MTIEDLINSAQGGLIRLKIWSFTTNELVYDGTIGNAIHKLINNDTGFLDIVSQEVAGWSISNETLWLRYFQRKEMKNDD